MRIAIEGSQLTEVNFHLICDSTWEKGPIVLKIEK